MVRILLLDTSTSTCRLTLVIDDRNIYQEWEAGRELGKGLLRYIEQQLAGQSLSWSDLTGVGVYKGPGSFTGLRIGITVMNTLSQSLGIPIVGATGEEWQQEAHQRLIAGENDTLVIPEYGRDAHITQPKK